MPSIPETLSGIVHGRVIELDAACALPDGQAVVVTVRSVGPPQEPRTGEGILASAGSWSDDPDGVDEFLRITREARRRDRPPIDP
ncbi:hypothetical protein Pla175_51550 [Pirellulimonas nuda]|uniref:Uncharacterized protein n=1 Tax=Pirellulimonas nuda TaxID=2528009 RepID=A0A518DJS1_9BACT|nr:hypothetical protein Pla175_51550 [Pirellulimonas nuda]